MAAVAAAGAAPGPPVPSGFQVAHSSTKGYGLFSGSAHGAGEQLFVDEPLFVMQHTGNRRVVAACAHCCGYIGSIRAQLGAVFNEARFAPLVAEVEGMVGGWEASLGGGSCSSGSSGVRCTQGCQELYCSEVCREAHFKHSHNLLCTGPIATEEHPLIQFKYHGIEHADTILLAAQAIAHLVNQSKALGGGAETTRRLMGELLCFCHAPFHEACRPPPGRGKDAEFLQHAQGLVDRASVLLRAALEPHAPVEVAQLFGSGSAFFSQVLGMFEYNNIDVDVPSPMADLFHARAQALHGAASVGGPDAPRAAAELQMLERLLREKEWVMACVWGEETTGIFDADGAAAMGAFSAEESDAAMDALDQLQTPGGMEGAASSAMASARKKVEAMSLQDLLQAPWPALHGVSLFTTVARINHSCEPNAKIDFVGNSARLTAVSLAPLAPGQELSISYIRQDVDVATRKTQLLEYGFVCGCPRCLREDSGQVRKAGKRLK